MHVIAAPTFYQLHSNLKKLIFCFLGLIVLFSVACVSIEPVEEYALARSALAAAKKYQASRYASGHWLKAEEYYKRAQQLYAEREYDQAKEDFVEARIYAERAEAKARLRIVVSGEE